MLSVAGSEDRHIASSIGLNFLWLELTNQCNLECAHCYAESGPTAGSRDVLVTADYDRLLAEGAALGCRAVQFIGGEPTLHAGLSRLIERARELEYDQVEVYTNGMKITDELLACFVSNKVSVAISLYADSPEMHDAVTGRAGSHGRTLTNVKRLLCAGIDLRIAIVAMEANRERVDETLAFVRALGIKKVGIDQARGVGRGKNVAAGKSDIGELCGHCWRGSLCVAADATVSTCVMSKAWPVGSVATGSLGDLVQGEQLKAVRQLIRVETHNPNVELSVDPCSPVCQPSHPPPCHPYICLPPPVRLPERPSA